MEEGALIFDDIFSNCYIKGGFINNNLLKRHIDMGLRSGFGFAAGAFLAVWAAVHFAGKGVKSEFDSITGNNSNDNPSSTLPVETRERYKQYGRDAADALGGLAEGFMENVGGQGNTKPNGATGGNGKYPKLEEMCLEPGIDACPPIDEKNQEGPLTRTF